MNEILFAMSLWRTPDDLTTSRNNGTRHKDSSKRINPTSSKKRRIDASAQDLGQTFFQHQTLLKLISKP